MINRQMTASCWSPAKIAASLAFAGLAGLLLAGAALAGELDVNGGAKYKGNFGLEVRLTDTDPTFVEDDSPASEARYLARFYVKVVDSSLSLPAGEMFTVFEGRDASSTLQFGLVLLRSGVLDEFRLIALVREDNGTIIDNVGDEILLVDGWRAIEVDWTASTAGQSDGFFDVYVEGQKVASLTGLNNEAARIDLVRLGAVADIPAGTSGNFRLDEFESRRVGETDLISAFDDVPLNHTFWDFIHAIYHAMITSGCTTSGYCPDSAVTRGQMAVFILRSIEGGDYTPPACATQVFDDVPCGSLFAAWINEFASRGITSGCSASPPLYCPGNPVTRAQMAVFLLRALEGSGYVPPACVTATFDDVSCGQLFADWINEFATRGITSGCSAAPPLYCPANSVTRGQMAKFLQLAFNLLKPLQ